MSRVQELKSQIVNYAQLYYSGQDTISDAEFDKLVDELRSLDPENIILTTTGWGYKVSDKDKVKHPIVNVGGMEKIKTTSGSSILFESATPKYDGASVELIYSNGKIVSAISRGNGEYGENRTDKLVPIVGTKLHIENLESEVQDLINNADISFSGEFILSKESLKKNYPGEISHRNIPSGFLNRDSVTPEECLRFSFIPYRINAIRVLDDKHLNVIQSLRDRDEMQGLLNKMFQVDVPYVGKLHSGDTYESILKEFSSVSDYNFDGVVANRKKLFDLEVKRTPEHLTYIYHYDEVAYKVVTDTADVTVKNIAWNLTRTRRAVPVVEFDPVELSGAMVQRATGHNANYIFYKGIEVGAQIVITRSGEVIPYILEVNSPVESKLQYFCPVCHGKLEWSGVDLVCNNPDCKSAKYNAVYQWLCTVGEFDGAGGSLYNAIIEYGEIDSVSDFYNKEIDWSGIVNFDGIGDSKLSMVLGIIQKLHDPIDLERMLVASNIKGLSWTNSYKLRCESNLEECIKNNTPDKFTVDNVKGVGWSVWNAIITNWDMICENYNLSKIIDHSNEITPAETAVESSEKLKICVTGKFNYGTRSKLFSDFPDILQEVDIKDAQYLVTNNPNSGSSKNKRAIELGVKVITEDELFNLDIFKKRGDN